MGLFAGVEQNWTYPIGSYEGSLSLKSTEILEPVDITSKYMQPWSDWDSNCGRLGDFFKGENV